MYKVKFIKEDIRLRAEEGESLLALMQRAGLNPNAPCGGNGKCKKCKVKIFTSENGEGEEVLACQTKVTRDLYVLSGSTTEDTNILTTAEGHSTEFHPMLQTLCVTVPPCKKGESISDWTRLAAELTQQTDQTYTPDPWIAASLPELLKKTKGEVYATVFAGEVLRVTQKRRPSYMAAFDIGTTTLVGYLLDAETGTECAVTSRMNPQAPYGADVISRANYALEHEDPVLTRCIREAVDEMLGKLSDQAGAEREDILAVSLVGNTCMHHLFLGISVDSLVHAPYNPALEEPVMLWAADYGLSLARKSRLLILPNIAGFVGADTVGCLVATDLPEQKEWTLLVDIGTNGEMVLAKDHHMAACSTAAGPAFEGAKISRGMRGAPGAISQVRWAEDHWECQVIEGGKARGICGSGLLDAVAALLLNGQMDESGELLTEENRVILMDGEHSEDGEAVALEQKDIRELQLAKAAIATGIHFLAARVGIQVSEIRQVWLAGAFGSFLSPESACNIGLIQPELRGRIRAIGNAAGEGAKRVLKDGSYWEKARIWSREADFLELAVMPEFQDQYVDELEFPEL